MHGAPLARRWLDHEVVISFPEEGEAGLPTPQDAAEEALHRAGLEGYRRLLAQYGNAFRKYYGWATEVVGNNYPRFRQIEEAAGMSAWRLAYEQATYPVHATSRPMTEEGFVRHGEDLAGRVASGLATPAILAIRSLMQATDAAFGVFAWGPEDIRNDLAMAALLDALGREAMDEWAAHEWAGWGLSEGHE
jgi:hypothetical protein